MNKSKKLQGIFIAVLAFIMVGMSVGFAAYTRQLTISGTTTVGQNKWSVHFKSEGLAHEIVGGATGENPAIADISGDSLQATFTPTLNKPNDAYIGTIPVTNDGTFNAKLTAATVTSMTDEQKKFARMIITFDGTEIYDSTKQAASGYSSGDDALSLGLAIGETKNLVVRISYVDSTNGVDLPASSDTVKSTVGLTFTQAD